MNRTEFERALASMSDEEFDRFRADFGGSHTTREQYVRDFVDHLNPHYEQRLCQLLGLKTEDEKNTEANVRAADASVKSAVEAKRSADAADRSARCAWAAVVVALIGMAISVAALVVRGCNVSPNPTIEEHPGSAQGDAAAG